MNFDEYRIHKNIKIMGDKNMSQQFWKNVLPLAFVLAFLVACSEDEPLSNNADENNKQDENNTQTENNSQSSNEDVNESDIDSEEETDYGTLLWKTYENMRFAYSIYYPSSWIIGEQSQNGDGVSLYEGDPDNEILVYGSLYIDEISEPFADAEKEGFTLEKITLDNGDVADIIVGMEDGKVLFKVIFIEDEVIYTFYAKVTPEFFDENVGLLLQTAKSLNVKELE